MSSFQDVTKKWNSLGRVSLADESKLCELLLGTIKGYRFSGPEDDRSDSQRRRIESLETTPQADNKLSDETLNKTVFSFFNNGLYNILQGVPDVEDDQVWKHVQKVIMTMHKQAYEHLWELVQSQFSSEQVQSILVKEFVPSFDLPENSTEAEPKKYFEYWFRKVHCSAGESHPPSDVRTLLSTMNSVLRAKKEALKGRGLSRSDLYQTMCGDQSLKEKCNEKLRSNELLRKCIPRPKELSDFSSQINKVVFAMLLHSSPIIPFTRLDVFLSAYHEPTRSAREDPNGRSVLVYRTPYLYFYHCGELKTLLKASISFETPPEKFVSAPRPAMSKEDLCKEVMHFFPIEKHAGFDSSRANKKTEAFIEWYRFADDTLASEMQHTSQPAFSQTDKKRAQHSQDFSGGFIKAFKKRHRLLDDNSLDSSDLSETLKGHIKMEYPRKSTGEIAEAARLVIALLCFPEPWIPFGVRDELYFKSHCHRDVTKEYQPRKSQRGSGNGFPSPSTSTDLRQIQCYLRPLLWNPVSNEPLFLAEVILK